MDRTSLDLLGLLKSWIPKRDSTAEVSRDFWMPDQSCRVCYECDSLFTLFNRRHHCRLCGRVFCAKCTSKSVPVPPRQPRSLQEECENVRVCHFCFKQWQKGFNHAIQVSNLDSNTFLSAASFISIQSSGTGDSSSISITSVPHSTVLSPRQSAVMESSLVGQDSVATARGSTDPADTRVGDPSTNQFSFCTTRSYDEDDEYGVYPLDSQGKHYSQTNGYFSYVDYDDIDKDYGSHKVHPNGEATDEKSVSSLSSQNNFDPQASEEVQQIVKQDISDEGEASSSLYAAQDANLEPVDFESSGVLWLPPEPEDEEDEREGLLFDDDDDDGDAAGEWGYLHPSSSFGSGEYRGRDRSNEEQKKVVKNVVDGHFRALVSQLMQVEKLIIGEEDVKESWLEIVTSLSWEAATLLKPDTSKGGGMDPGGYVKVKCIASGRRSDSAVVKGVVCKKNVAHRRMTSKIEKARILILEGALEYQRVSNHLSSFDTLLQQEMDHLKMAVAKIDAHNPDVLLVEKSVSRHAQEYLLEKDISLVLNIKKPVLERIARCTGGQIVHSVDHLSSQKMGYCDMFHVKKFLEEHGTAGEIGKKLVKTLMYFDGCPKPLGCTILLRGANGDELKKVKRVVQYSFFAAYHLALETSFLADEGASLPELPLNSPITVALPDKPSAIDRSISTIPGFTIPAGEKTQGPLSGSEPQRSMSSPPTDLVKAASICTQKMGVSESPGLCAAKNTMSSFCKSSLHHDSNKGIMDMMKCSGAKASVANDVQGYKLHSTSFVPSQEVDQGMLSQSVQNDCNAMDVNQSHLQLDGKDTPDELTSSKEEFPPSPSDNQSILVSLSSRCVWKGTVCERSHLFRIKYYGNFDKPLGRFLRDHLFDQSFRCRSCEMPSEAHVQCYTHRQGTLTISVKKLLEILLPGEKDGKIWMWHRCLKCPRDSKGFPPATRRVVMSDAAWGLSFGKFLELSFSNHAAASRVASCGHSLHRDCLRFYGFGKMVACFRYASIDVHSVYLPPSKLDFNYENQEWIQHEVNEVIFRADLLFAEVLNAIRILVEKRSGRQLSSSVNRLEARRQISDLEGILQKEKEEFEESLQRILTKEVKKGQSVDILEINRLRRQLLFQSYVWDHRLLYAASMDDKTHWINGDVTSLEPEKPLVYIDKSTDLDNCSDPSKCPNSSESVSAILKTGENGDEGKSVSQISHVDAVHQESVVGFDADCSIEKPPGLPVATKSFCGSHPEESILQRRRALSDGQFPSLESLSDTLDAAWTGETTSGVGVIKGGTCKSSEPLLVDTLTTGTAEKVYTEDHGVEEQSGTKLSQSLPLLSSKGSENIEDAGSWLGVPFISFYRTLNKNFLPSAQKLDPLGGYKPVYISSFRESDAQSGASLLLPVGVNETVIPVYDDEPTSIISYALASHDYHAQLSDELKKSKDATLDSNFSFQSLDSSNLQSPQSIDEMVLESYRSLGSMDESLLSLSVSRSSFDLDPLSHTKTLHARVSFADDGSLGKVKYSVTCYYAKRFEALRQICCPSEMDFIRSLSRCKKWGAQGGKSNVFFAKTLDDRFIIKQVTKTELESFMKFAPAYFKYLSESIISGSPTCLAKILGIYQVSSKHLKGGKESKMDVLVMENLLFGRNLTRLYDLKGSARSRYNADSSGSNKVLLDQNLIESMPTSPIFVGNKAKRLLERAVWNDTAFLALVDVMDYSLLVGVDEEKNELVLGIIDFMRQYTWDKHLETWVKASGILGGPKNASPTIISPKQYKKRFRKAMTTYFLMVPDQWSPPSIIPSKSQTNLCDENMQGG